MSYPKERVTTVEASDARGFYIHVLQVKDSFWSRWRDHPDKVPIVSRDPVFRPGLTQDVHYPNGAPCQDRTDQS